MKRKTFDRLSASDKRAVTDKYPDAAPGDGYWYHMHDGRVIQRTGGYGRPVPPHRSGGGHWVGG